MHGGTRQAMRGVLDTLARTAFVLVLFACGCRLGQTDGTRAASGTEGALAGQRWAPPLGIYQRLSVPGLVPWANLPEALPEPPPPPSPQAVLPEPELLDQEQPDPPSERAEPNDVPEELPPLRWAPDVQGRTSSQGEQSETLALEHVLDSVQQRFPLLLAATLEPEVAAGKRLAAEGAFDLSLRGRTAAQQGTFENQRFELLAEQPTVLHGASWYGGYRLGNGKFPVYYGDRLTADGGEFRAGLQLPLLRDGPIDRRRVALLQAQISEQLARPFVDRARIDFLRAAAYRYWDWVAAGTHYQISRRLLEIAQQRQDGLEIQFEAGQVAEFVVVDNQRLIVERQGLLIAAERRWQQAAFELSLYLRDDSGNPLQPRPESLPQDFLDRDPAVLAPQSLQQDIQTALLLRPELARFDLLKRHVAADVELARNQELPGLSVGLAAAQDVGEGKKAPDIFALDRAFWETSLHFDVPVQRRDARGRLRTARATLQQLSAQERFARDQIVVDVQDAHSNLDRTYARLGFARQEQQVAERVAQLELERFQRGAGTLLEVNLRELAAAGAQAKVADALADYFKAIADYRAALGLDAALPPGRGP